jgi:hypothetical protein
MIEIRSIVTLSLPQDFFLGGAGWLNELGLVSPSALAGPRVVASDDLTMPFAPLLFGQALPRWMSRAPGRSPLRFVCVCGAAGFVGGMQVLCVALVPCALGGAGPLLALRCGQARATAAAGCRRSCRHGGRGEGVPGEAVRVDDTLYRAMDFFCACTVKGTRVRLPPLPRAVEGIASDLRVSSI